MLKKLQKANFNTEINREFLFFVTIGFEKFLSFFFFFSQILLYMANARNYVNYVLTLLIDIIYIFNKMF